MGARDDYSIIDNDERAAFWPNLLAFWRNLLALWPNLLALWPFLLFFVGSFLFVFTFLFLLFSLDSPLHPQFKIYTLSISNFTVTNDSKVSFAADVWLTARNPNALHALSFGLADVSIYYRSLSLARTAMPPFSVGCEEEGEAHLKVSFAAVGNIVERDSVVLDLKLSTSLKYEQSVWRRGLFEVFCGGLVVGIPRKPTEVGVLVGGPRPCWEN